MPTKTIILHIMDRKFFDDTVILADPSDWQCRPLKVHHNSNKFINNDIIVGTRQAITMSNLS